MSVYLMEGTGYKYSKGLSKKSINAISKFLGYNEFQVHTFFGTGSKKILGIDCVAFKMFTNEILFIITKKKSDFLLRKRVKLFLTDFDYNYEYDKIFVEDIFLDAIQQKAYRINFLSDVLNFSFDDLNDEYYSNKLDIYLFFIEGDLVSFKYGNSLNKWAQHLRDINPDIIRNYAKEARIYWGNNDYDAVFEEINRQADAFSNIPNPVNNKYVKYHRTDFNNIDFVMLEVCHFTQRMTLDEFKTHNHGRFAEKVIDQGKISYTKGNFEYEFSEAGILEKVFLIKK